MHLVITIAAFVVTLAILVTIHEYGHYWVARRCGIRVLTFSIGFGKPIYSWQRGATRWQIAAIPLGGYVKMLDEREAPVAESERRFAFNAQPPLKKMAVVVAGPLANLLLALVLYTGLNIYGIDTIKPEIGSVTVDSIAEKAGLKSGEQIVAVNGEAVGNWDELFLQILSVVGDGKVLLQVQTENGAQRPVTLSFVELGRAAFDAKLLANLGISPWPLTARIEAIEPDGAAAKAGLQAGDELLGLNGVPLKQWSQLQAVLLHDGSKAITLLVKRQSQQFTITVQPKVLTQNGVTLGRLGVQPAMDETRWNKTQIHVRYAPVEALQVAAKTLWLQTKLTLTMFGHMLTGKASLKQVSGPLTIADVTGQSIRLGIAPFINTLALISLSLGVLNLLPVPVLDGGHLMYHTAELLTGRPVPASVEAIGQRIGLAFLIGLMSLALFNDFHRFLFG
ncbi:RIP metalloprotease RseP [Andreprevotia chitinilytica]|uniref:RIP metalloprotease RseP n=1 Tax=Andreprevotia chitinilytica TaxID=396808 RepID=UPI00054D2A35|nr:RIP metalloprotease RseP [Andreprevotia chitinilytica]